MKYDLELSQFSIVVVGALNPAIFNPDWFARMGLVAPQVAGSANIEVVHPDISIFNLGAISFKVERERLIAETNEAPFTTAADLVSRIFGEFLSHTPLRALGINREVHFRVGSFEKRNALGLKLAPREPWGEWGKSIDEESGGRKGGLRTITLEQQALDDREFGHVQVTVEPSRRLSAKDGIMIRVNDHWEARGGAADDAQFIATTLSSSWSNSVKKSESIISSIMDGVK